MSLVIFHLAVLPFISQRNANALHAEVDATQSSDNLARTHPMGWSTWNHFHHDISDALIRAQAEAMVSSGMRDVDASMSISTEVGRGNATAPACCTQTATCPI